MTSQLVNLDDLDTRTLQAVQSYLNANETIEMVVVNVDSDKNGVFIITNQRLIFVHAPWQGPTNKTIDIIVTIGMCGLNYLFNYFEQRQERKMTSIPRKLLCNVNYRSIMVWPWLPRDYIITMNLLGPLPVWEIRISADQELVMNVVKKLQGDIL